ncbi:MAG: DUF1570 domain-containing protein [Planctomycetota bacterium]
MLFRWILCSSVLIALGLLLVTTSHADSTPQTPRLGHAAPAVDDDDEVDHTPPTDNFAPPSQLEAKVLEDAGEAIAETMKLLRKGDGEGDVHKVIRRVKKARKKAPEYAALDYYLGRLYQWDENYKQARKYYNRSIETNPRFYESISALGEIAVSELELEDGLKEFDRALAIHPWYDEAIYQKYDLYLLKGELPKAKVQLERLMKVSDISWLPLAMEMVDSAIRGPSWPTTFVSETKNYIVKTGISQEMADLISANAEKIRTLYGKYFVDVDRVGRKYEIIVYRSKGEYHANGGPRTAAGHYSPYIRSMHLYPHERLSDMLLVLYHEGFHQYLHEYLDNIPQWFNEGLGDFFGGAMINRAGTKAQMGPSPWRVNTVKLAWQRGLLPPVAELMNMTREQMYDPEKAGLYYAQAWAIVYYCMESGQSKHKKALVRYFSALRKGLSSRDAFRTSFGKIDMDQFDRNLRNFIDRCPDRDEIWAAREAIVKPK